MTLAIIRAELKKNALDSLKGNWGLAVAVVLVYLVISGVLGVIPVIGTIATIFILPTLVLGLITFFLKTARNEMAEIQDLFSGFPNLLKAFCLNFMMSLFIFLWTLLLIVPGIIATFRYAMAFYILVDNPQIGVFDAINESKRIMQGHKWELFVLYLSFLGWILLAILTFGIGFLWLSPYMMTTVSNFYDKIKGETVIEY